METENNTGKIIAEIAKETQDKAPEPTTPNNPALNSANTEIKPEKRIHAAGQPSTRKPGETRGRKPNREKNLELEISNAAQEETEKTVEQRIEERARELTDYKITGQQLADGFIYSNVIFFGVEFNFLEPIRDANGNVIKDERTEFYKTGANLAETYNWRNLPPWIQIAFIMASYYGIRAAMPPVRARFGGYLKGFFGWVGKKMGGLFRRKPEALPTGNKPTEIK